MSENTKQKKYTLKDKIKAVGPGAMITASFIGPGTVTTATRAGASFGYVLLWTVIFSIIAAISLQEMAARLGIVTRKGLGEAIVDNCKTEFLKKFSIILVGGSIVLGCASYISGDLSGTALAVSTLLGIKSRYIGSIIGVFVLIIVYIGSAKLLEKMLTVMVAIMAFVFVTTMFVSKPDVAEMFKGIMPTFPEGGLMYIISVIGTTVVPYNFFIHAISAKNSFKSTDELVLSKWDTYSSILVGGIITASILITSGTLMRGNTIKSAADMAIQLKPLLGEWAKEFMSIGLFAAGLSSAIATPIGASYTLSGLLGWKYDNSDNRFKYLNMSIVIIGIVVAGLGLNPLTIIMLAQALNGVILPIIAVYLVWITSREKVLGKFKNSNIQILVGGFVAIITVVLGMNSAISAVKFLIGI